MPCLRALLALLLAALALPPSAAAGEPGARIVVQHEAGLTRAERAHARAGAGALAAEPLTLPRTEVLTVAAHEADRALAALRQDPAVRWAEPDALLRASAPAPDDSAFGNLWGLSNTGQLGGVPGADMNVLGAWDLSTGAGQTVAVVDGWVDAAHPDLAGQVTTGRAFALAGSDPTGAGYDHGTHVTGTIAARRGNGMGVAGVAPDARVLAVAALDDTGQGYSSTIATAFDYAGGQARIVSASLGGPGGANVLAAAIRRHPATLFVVAAGNASANTDTTPEYPCAVDAANVLCVGASTRQDGMASFSNYGASTVDLFAPGAAIYSTVPGGGYAWLSGTSMATPAVAGEAALVLARAPHLGAIGLKQVLMASAVAKPAFQGASVTGARADAARAAASVAAPLSPPADADGDGAADAGDNCPAAANRGQGDADGDGTGDACDATPHPPAPAADRDADGRPDAADTCPAERAATRTGCPVPTVRRLSLALGAGRRSATVRVRPDRAARATITIEHRRCARRRCHWARLLRRNIALPSRGASLRLEAPRGRRLPHGSYRVRAVLSSAAGTARPVVRAFRL